MPERISVYVSSDAHARMYYTGDSTWGMELTVEEARQLRRQLNERIPKRREPRHRFRYDVVLANDLGMFEQTMDERESARPALLSAQRRAEATVIPIEQRDTAIVYVRAEEVDDG